MLAMAQQHIHIVLGIVVLVACFYCIGRVMQARQAVSLAFGLVPMMLLWALQQSLV